jgi:hypothetical protein
MMRAACLAVVLVLVAAASSLAQMPDPTSMSGLSMPAPELPDGSVTVRVVKGDISNNLAGITVDLQGGGQARTEKTGADGRATFSGLVAGTTVRVAATIDGKRLESQPIEVPATGGMRTLLAAPADGAAAPAPEQGSGAPAASGAGQAPASSDTSALSLGGSSRIAGEFSDDVLQIFLLLEIVNRSSVPVKPASALVFDMPTGAEGTTVLDGSTPQANAKGPRVTVPGPFPPGSTSLQIAYRLGNVGKDHAVEQVFPLPLDAVSIAVQRLGDMKVTSPQVAQTAERSIERSVYVIGNGPRLDAGKALVINLENLPYRSRLPVYAAVGLVVLIILGAAYASFAPGQVDAVSSRRRDLLDRREKGLAALATLERQYRAGSVDEARYQSRRATLVAQLERIYGELDADGSTPGGQGVAA